MLANLPQHHHCMHSTLGVQSSGLVSSMLLVRLIACDVAYCSTVYAYLATHPKAYIVKERYNPCGLLVAGRCLQHGMNYNTMMQDNARINCKYLAKCRVMLCKLLIYKDKLRITLEWIHSQGESRGAWIQSRPINGRKLYRVQHSTGNPAQHREAQNNLTQP